MPCGARLCLEVKKAGLRTRRNPSLWQDVLFLLAASVQIITWLLALCSKEAFPSETQEFQAFPLQEGEGGNIQACPGKPRPESLG